MKIDNMRVTCSICKAEEMMEILWNEFKLPNGWKYRIKSWENKDATKVASPDDIQITYSDKCRSKCS